MRARWPRRTPSAAAASPPLRSALYYRRKPLTKSCESMCGLHYMLCLCRSNVMNRAEIRFGCRGKRNVPPATHFPDLRIFGGSRRVVVLPCSTNISASGPHGRKRTRSHILCPENGGARPERMGRAPPPGRSPVRGPRACGQPTGHPDREEGHARGERGDARRGARNGPRPAVPNGRAGRDALSGACDAPRWGRGGRGAGLP